ncbi:hypothetical protein [Acidimicrobium ferrooxidans]|uniref:hypothetical protein n=1 Tax=Acidimicrobium ferrooxidans TaxID=53635 RepID=UPI00019DE45D|nr:hypothetical protein [Acidimicrobium ferrooxidans]
MTGQPRSTQRRVPTKPESSLDATITEVLRTFALANPRQGVPYDEGRHVANRNRALGRAPGPSPRAAA